MARSNGRNRRERQQDKKNPNTVTIYVKDPELWDRARRCAESFGDSLSEYVEIAVGALNSGTIDECPRCEQVRQILKGHYSRMDGQQKQ